MTSQIEIAGVKMTKAAAQNVEETGTDVAVDLHEVRGGKSAARLLAECIDGAEQDRVQGWREYVDAVVAVASDTLAQAILTISRRAHDATLRAMLTGEYVLVLTHAEADDLGDEAMDWCRAKGLSVDTSGDAVTIRAKR